MKESERTPEDDFWDLSSLTEKKTHSAEPFLSRPTVSSFYVSGEENAFSHEENRLSVTRIAEGTSGEAETYVPAWSSYLTEVTLERKKGNFDFFGAFASAARLYFDRAGESCDFVQFYSYMPQYIQMNERQKAYYFYFRSAVREGKQVRTDYSYIYLLVSEIVNLPDLIETSTGLDMLFRIWRDYRKELPRLDLFFPTWIEDYCLIHALPCPHGMYGELLRSALNGTQMREFYFSDGKMDGAMVLSLCSAFSSYDFRFSKMIPQDKHEEYVRHMTEALGRFFGVFNRMYSLETGGKTTLVRDAYRSLVCSQAARVKLRVEYKPLVSGESAILTVTNAVKYAENKMRALYSVKSRLGVKFLSEELKKTIDAYFSAMEAEAEREKKKAALPSYYAQYDAPREALSTAGADEIESASWTTTARLVEETEMPALGEMTENTVITEKTEKGTSECPAYQTYLQLLYDGNKDGLRSFFREAGLPEASFVDSVNDLFADLIGDVVIEETGDGYRLIEDYREDVASWLRTNVQQK